MSARVAIFLSHDDPAALRLAGSCALAAASMESRVDVFVFGRAVAALLEAAGDADHPGARLLAARGEGCRLLACSASVVEERVDAAEAAAGYDAVIGWPTVHDWTRGVAERFFF
jgi:intracellular sulfur oxidation DsrE/DsrF family protein